jgi:hypothetical protein
MPAPRRQRSCGVLLMPPEAKPLAVSFTLADRIADSEPYSGPGDFSVAFAHADTSSGTLSIAVTCADPATHASSDVR